MRDKLQRWFDRLTILPVLSAVEGSEVEGESSIFYNFGMNFDCYYFDRKKTMPIDLNDTIRRTLEEIAGPHRKTALPRRQPPGGFGVALLVLPEIELQKKDKSAKSSRKKPVPPPASNEVSQKPRRWRGVQGSGFRVQGLPEGIL